MPVTVFGPMSVVLSDPNVLAKAQLASLFGINLKAIGNGQVKMSGITDLELFDLPTLAYLVGNGFEAEDYPVFFALTPAELASAVPANFPNREIRTYDPANPQAPPTVTAHTWESWGDPAVEFEGVWYKSNADRANLGRPIPASLWISAGLSLVSVAQYKALNPSAMTP